MPFLTKTVRFCKNKLFELIKKYKIVQWNFLSYLPHISLQQQQLSANMIAVRGTSERPLTAETAREFVSDRESKQNAHQKKEVSTAGAARSSLVPVLKIKFESFVTFHKFMEYLSNKVWVWFAKKHWYFNHNQKKLKSFEIIEEKWRKAQTECSKIKEFKICPPFWDEGPSTKHVLGILYERPRPPPLFPFLRSHTNLAFVPRKSYGAAWLPPPFWDVFYGWPHSLQSWKKLLI